MAKKVFALVLVVAMLLCLGSVAFAVPSKTTVDLATVATTTTSTGVALAEDFKVSVAEESTAVSEELASIFKFVTDTAKPVVDFFDETVKEQIAALLPVDFDLTKLLLNECVPLNVFNYDAAYGDLTIDFTFATKYAVDQKLVALAGLFVEKDVNGEWVMEWYAFPATVVEGTDGAEATVEITFTQDFLTKLGTGTATLAILSEDIPLTPETPAAN